MHKWILKDYHQLENAYECGHTHSQSLDRESRKDFTLGNPPLPPVTALRLDWQRQVMGHSPFSRNLPSLFADSKWLREAFPYWQENLRQVVLLEATDSSQPSDSTILTAE